MNHPHFDDGPAPYRRSDRKLDLDVTGYATLFNDGHPTALVMPGTNDIFVAVFSTREKAVQAARVFDICYDSVKCVTDGSLFWADIVANKARLIIDPHRVTGGKMHFNEVTGWGESARGNA